MKIIIFNVEHGFCGFVRSPNGYGLMIDCGRRDDFSPAQYIASKESNSITKHNGQILAFLIITHPHDDHVEDIENIIKYLPPRILYRQGSFNWEELKQTESKNDYRNLDIYSNWQKTYSGTPTYPDWGMDFVLGPCLSVEESKVISKSSFVNNCSLLTSIQYGGEKILFCGDLMEDGWAELLKRAGFREFLRGTSILVAAHHGHSSGFSLDALRTMGKPKFAIVSAKRKDQSVDDRYGLPEYFNGIDFLGNKRFMFSTRYDGNIVLENGAFGWMIATDQSNKYGTF